MYSRHPMICRMNPSALLMGTAPLRYAASAAATTSPGNNNPLFRYGDNRECARCQFDFSIASSCSPNIGSTSETKNCSRFNASTRVVAHTPVGASPHVLPVTSAMTCRSNSSSSYVIGVGQRSWPVFGGGKRFSSSKFHFPSTGSSPSISTFNRRRCHR